MRKPVLLAVMAAFVAFGAISCSDDRGYDPVPGPNTDEPEPEVPEVDLSMLNVEAPSVAKDNEYFWVFSSNHDMESEDYPYKKGLMSRRSKDLVEFEIKDYVLNDVIAGWAEAKLTELQPGIDKEKIRICDPSVAKAGDEWRLYYTVNAGLDAKGDNATLIGYAVSPSLDNQVWTDKGIVMSSASLGGSGAIAAKPCFFTSIDGSKHYMAYGVRTGLYVTELNPVTSEPIGEPAVVAQQGDRTSKATIYVHKDRYYIFFAFEHISQPEYSYVFMAQSTAPTGPYVDYCTVDGDGNPVLRDVAKIFPENRIFTPYYFTGSKWGNFNSLSVVSTGTRDLIATHSKANLDQKQPFVLQIRTLDWLATVKEWDYPCIGTELYAGDLGKVTAADIVGDWGYGTLWYDYDKPNNCAIDAMTFNADNTVVKSGESGTWDFNEATSTLHFVATWWGGENIYVKVNKVKDLDGGEERPDNISASGFNATFWHHPGVWMKKVRE